MQSIHLSADAIAPCRKIHAVNLTSEIRKRIEAHFGVRVRVRKSFLYGEQVRYFRFPGLWQMHKSNKELADGIKACGLQIVSANNHFENWFVTLEAKA